MAALLPDRCHVFVRLSQHAATQPGRLEIHPDSDLGAILRAASHRRLRSSAIRWRTADPILTAPPCNRHPSARQRAIKHDKRFKGQFCNSVRGALAWRISNTLHADFCVDALEEALRRFGRPEIFNTDQGSQFTSTDFAGVLKAHGIRISMDGKGRCMDNIFVERLWRSLKYEDVYLHAYTSVAEARAGIAAWLHFYNEERLHQAHGYRTPR